MAVNRRGGSDVNGAIGERRVLGTMAGKDVRRIPLRTYKGNRQPHVRSSRKLCGNLDSVDVPIRDGGTTWQV